MGLTPLSANNSFGSNIFLNALQKLLLTQHVDFPTHARGSDTPYALDLVITDSQFMNNNDALAPLGNSDHFIIMIAANFLSPEFLVHQKYNYMISVFLIAINKSMQAVKLCSKKSFSS